MATLHPALTSADAFAAHLTTELSTLLPEGSGMLGPDTDLLTDLAFDSLAMLALFDVLDSLLGPDAAFEFDVAVIGSTIRSVYLYCLESLQRPLGEVF